jgi:hypothetical protein
MTSMKPNVVIDSEKKLRYEVYLDPDTHWALVALGARNRMHGEDYAELVLTEYVQTVLDREAESGGS